MSRTDPPRNSLQKLLRLADNPWAMLVLVLHVGLLGIPVYWRARYSLAVRWFIIIASIVYTVAVIWICIWFIGWLGRLFTG